MVILLLPLLEEVLAAAAEGDAPVAGEATAGDELPPLRVFGWLAGGGEVAVAMLSSRKRVLEAAPSNCSLWDCTQESDVWQPAIPHLQKLQSVKSSTEDG
jgi:hypothetical protein